ncbi:MAG: Tol-Pal system beta propeller repeat protein TolB [Alphaproteobacteria bacterium]|nr:Tol-Pal system beta propeller repeat protein TolB [Alphaproteobacteria bacterium]
MLKLKSKTTLILFIMLSLFINKAKAELSIDITGAQSAPMAVALPDFSSNNENTKKISEKIGSIIQTDLESTGIFRIVDKFAYIQHFKSANDIPTFVDWQSIAVEALIQGEINKNESGKYKLKYRLWDIPASKEMISNELEFDMNGLRRAAHMIADTIYQRITGEDGYFDTRIVYVSETGTTLKRKTRLAIMDQDGENHKYLTNGLDLVLTPRFSPNMQQITYLSYYNNTPRVYLFDIETGKQKVVGNFPGMTFAPRFSPDGKKLIMSMALNGNSEIYEMDLKTNVVTQLTKHPMIDTSPSYSPDGKKITFNSDRGGNQQIYVMNRDGSGVKRISWGVGRYATPVWSPRGDYIAFTKILGGKFYIGVMFPNGKGERIIAEGWMVEAPTWSPNGRILMYFSQEKPKNPSVAPKTKIHAVDITGYNDRILITPSDASHPAWSPLLTKH